MDSTSHITGNSEWQTVAKRELFSDRERRAYLLFGAWFGTTLAGGSYGMILFLWKVLAENFSQSSFESTTIFLVVLGKIALGCIAGFALGAMWAGYVSAAVTALVPAILLSLDVRRTPLWVASCVGAWTAFFCYGNFSWPPILMGQGGAWYFAHLKTRSTDRIFPQVDRSLTHRFGLGQLLRLTTVLCVASAIVSLLPLSDEYRLQMGYCLAWQCVSILLIVGGQSVWAKRST